MSKIATKPPPNDLYEVDFFLWTQEQARLLRERRWADEHRAALAGFLGVRGGAVGGGGVLVRPSISLAERPVSGRAGETAKGC